MKKIERSKSIIGKTVLLNFINVFRYYPKMLYMATHLDKYTYDQTYNYCIKLIKIVIDKAKIPIKTFGLENLPKQDGYYLCANHQEKFDPLAIWYSFPQKTGVIINDAACHRPVISELCKLIKSQKIIFNNMHSILKCFNQVTEELKNGNNYLVFPEGAYEKEYNTLSKFHSGCFKSPLRAKCPIVPIAIKNSYRIFDKGLKTTKPIEIHYLKPIYPDEYKNLTSKMIAKMVKEKIQKEFIS